MNSALHNVTPSRSISNNSHMSLHPQDNHLTAPELDASSIRYSGNSNSAQAFHQTDQISNSNKKSSRRPRLKDENALVDSELHLNATRHHNNRRGQTSITHLMNFTSSSFLEDHRNTTARGIRRGNFNGIGSGRHFSDKTRYIHVNYRFIVRPNGNYNLQAVDADQPLNWSDILQIIVSSISQDALCPICLSRPVAPRIAKCGHIFCLPCLIRYIHSTQESVSLPEKKARWKRCPICWDSVYITETRPVRWYSGQENPAPREGDDVVLRLFMRLSGNTLALPRDGADAIFKSKDIPFYYTVEVMDYARIMKGSEEYMIGQYNHEIEDLNRLECEDLMIFGEEPKWTRKAILSINEAKETLKVICGPPSDSNVLDKNKNKRQPRNYSSKIDVLPTRQTSKSSQEHKNSNETVIPSESSYQRVDKFDLKHCSNNQDQRTHPNAYYFFYQALPQFYLSPLDIRILKSAFGNYKDFPSVLIPRVERISSGHIMDHELRKRAKYLSHLPHGCEVGFLECDWANVIMPEILEQFQAEIRRRRKKNSDKQIREERDKLRAEKAEEDEQRMTVRRQPSIGSEIIPEGNFHIPILPSLDLACLSPAWPRHDGLSFIPIASQSPNLSTTRTVWGTTVVQPAYSEEVAEIPENYSDDGWLNPEKVKNELIADFQKLSLGKQSTEVTQAEGIGQSKKKKAKKITLMSTTVRRNA